MQAKRRVTTRRCADCGRFCRPAKTHFEANEDGGDIYYICGNCYGGDGASQRLRHGCAVQDHLRHTITYGVVRHGH